MEGLELLTLNPPDNTPEFFEFKARCLDRFGQAPSFGTVLGYEAANVLALALEKTGGKADGLARELADIQNFKGLSDIFSLDQYGDAVRPNYLAAVRGGAFVYTKTLIPKKL